MEFSSRRAWIWVLVTLFVSSMPLVSYTTGWVLCEHPGTCTSAETGRMLVDDIFIASVFQIGMMLFYMLFIRFYWKPYHGMGRVGDMQLLLTGLVHKGLWAKYVERMRREH